MPETRLQRTREAYRTDDASRPRFCGDVAIHDDYKVETHPDGTVSRVRVPKKYEILPCFLGVGHNWLFDFKHGAWMCERCAMTRA